MLQDDSVMEYWPGGRRRLDRVLSPEYLAGLQTWSLSQVRAARDEAAQEETDLSFLRRLLHARIDIVHAEQKRRREGGSASVVEKLVAVLANNAGPSGGHGRYRDLEPSRAQAHRRYVEALIADVDLSNVVELSDSRLNEALKAYRDEEETVSPLRDSVQAVIDTLNAEIARRYREGDASIAQLLENDRD